MKREILLVVMVTLCSCDFNSKVEKDYYSNGNIRSEVEVKNGRRNGLAKMFYSNGQLESKSHYLNDNLNGESISYDSTGDILTKGFFLKGNAVGPISYYHKGNLILYNERDWANKVYYVIKFDSAGLNIQKEEGHCFSKNWAEDFTVNNGELYQFTFFYAEPPGYINDLKAYVRNKEVSLKKLEEHLAKVELENIPNVEFIIISTLRDKLGIIKCTDTLVKSVSARSY